MCCCTGAVALEEDRVVILDKKKLLYNYSFHLNFQEAMEKDTMEKVAEPNLNLKAYLADAYLHPIFRSFEDIETGEVRINKNQSHITSPAISELSSPSPPRYVYHYEVEP